MCLFGSAAAEGARAVIEQPAQVREVYDVSGAGDTVLATLAHFMAQGRPVDEAMRWANTAAGIVVGKFGTAAVTLDELQAAMAQQAATPPEHLSQPRTRHADQPL